MLTRRLPRATFRWLFAAGVIAAFVSQLAVVLSPLAEAREGQSFASHVEQGGTSSHYAHNDATCITCQARTLTGPTARPQTVPAPTEVSSPVISRVLPAAIAAKLCRPKNPRAPPLNAAEV
ncbi:MAG TPA: hypothetical protein VKH19_10525 [Gemmatimonadaceae bacterium]|nr:hypothetical protein [Gemmatimonadaceae bacterium]